MITRPRSTVPGQAHKLSCGVYGDGHPKAALIVSVELHAWDGAISRAGVGGLSGPRPAGPPPSGSNLLIDDLTRAIRFLPAPDWPAGDGVAGAVLITMFWEQRVRADNMVTIALSDNQELSARLPGAIELLDVVPRSEASIDLVTGSLIHSARHLLA